jgi:hypothetical protein
VAGLAVFVVAQATVVLAGVSVASGTNAWRSIGHFFTVLGAAGLTGVLAALAAALLAGGYAAIRRITV